MAHCLTMAQRSPVKASPLSAQQRSVFDAVFDGSAVAGAFGFADDGVPPYNSLLYVCPCGCGDVNSLPIATGEKQSRYWKWNGNRECPTLEPSIRRLDGCKFHGFLVEGVWMFCDDSGAHRG